MANTTLEGAHIATGSESILPLTASIELLRSSRIFVPSFFLFCAIYHLLAPLYSTPKQLSWILTTVVSATMTLVSIPFVWDYVSSGGDVKSVRTLSSLSYATTRMFQAYLVSDLLMGAIYYRSQVALVTGWIHHILYVFIVQICIKRAWTQIFCLCALMELPTFLLAISSLYPRLRSNIAFAVTFFVTRILLHLIWCISYLIPVNRKHTTGGSILPSVLLAGVFPMHALWFQGCVKGFIKRHNERRLLAPQTVDVDATMGPISGQRDQTLSTPATYISFRPASQGRLAEKQRSPNVPQHAIHRTWPGRKVVYDFIGLSRPTPIGPRRASSADD